MKRAPLLFAASLLVALTAFALAQNPNPAGAELTAPLVEAYSGETASNPGGATVILAGPMDVSAETTNPAGAKLYLGVIDPNHSSAADAAEWDKYH